MPDGGHRERRLQPAGGAAVRCGAAGVGRAADARSTTAIPTSFPTAASWWSARRRRACSWPPSWRGGPAGDALRRRARPAAADLSRPRRPVVDGRVGRLGRAVRRGRRPGRGPGACRHPSWSAPPNARRSTSTRSPTWASSSSAGWATVRTAARCSPVGCATCSPSPTSSCERLLDTFDDGPAATTARTTSSRPSAPRRRGCLHPRGCSSTCGSGEIRTVVWATGYRPDYGWLDVPVVDPKGQLRHDGGMVDSPACTRSGCRSCAGASPRSSTASRTTRVTWSLISAATLAERRCPPEHQGLEPYRPSRSN